ncbi:mammalian cell entry protein [Mycolicibacterium novocastrense]|uniref:MCE family protein n=1 Tax=Mycolicibacterium novocastrense TaxID=59813 RepID=UPI00074AD93A|nr:mammalian cell entry protein [Mycolicibacterium novocastrense]KUH71202.1 mammalian cell entry protein [Mycolicibacterium novocastrense]KUH73362.1 mammalian cell entry protein [Mycolicibacterium novocastrense]
MRKLLRHSTVGLTALTIAIASTGCEWNGLNSMSLPGTEGGGPGSFVVQAQLPDVGYIQQNSRVRVGDANVGTITKIERQGWHALVTMTLNPDVDLPANATAKVGQTSLLGSLHIELAPPVGVPAEGRLHDGSLIPLEHAGTYPGTDQTLSALSLMLNGGGIGQVQDITAAFATAFKQREGDLRSLIEQIDQFTAHLNAQTTDILDATDSFNGLVTQLADQKPVLDRAIHSIPDALAVLADQRENLVEASTAFGRFSALAADTVNQSKENLVKELEAVGPILQSLADTGPDLTRSLDFIGTFPWPKGPLDKWIRGDYANITAIADLTLSRIDNNIFTGTRWEGNLTELEMQWGRTIGQLPSPYTATNPLVAPYRLDQGP